MLTPQQFATIETQLRDMHKEHVGDLLSLSNALVARIDPRKRGQFREHFDGIVSETSKAISSFGERLVAEVPHTVANMKNALDESERDQVIELCRGYLMPDLYFKRITTFKESVERRLRGYGLTFNPADYRIDLVDSRYEVAILNSMAGIKSRIQNRLDVLVYADKPVVQVVSPPSTSTFEEANQLLELKPNIAGIGLNINRLLQLIERWWRSRR